MGALDSVFRAVSVVALAHGAPVVADVQVTLPPTPPNEMGSFAFLIGTWDCRGTWRQTDGTEREFEATWQGKLLLDGHVQVEEYRAIWPDGETFVYGLNYRMFDTGNEQWIVKWFDALRGDSFDLGQPNITGDAEAGLSIVFTPGDEKNRQRAIFKNISEDAFFWQGDFSADGGETWDVAAMEIKCTRAQK